MKPPFLWGAISELSLGTFGLRAALYWKTQVTQMLLAFTHCIVKNHHLVSVNAKELLFLFFASALKSKVCTLIENTTFMRKDQRKKTKCGIHFRRSHV